MNDDPRLTPEDLAGICKTYATCSAMLKSDAQALIDLVRSNPHLALFPKVEGGPIETAVFLAKLITLASRMHDSIVVAKRIDAMHEAAHAMAKGGERDDTHDTSAADALLRSVFGKDGGQ